MATWSIDDIPWDRFDKSRVNPDIVPIVKAACVVEYNAGDYRHYLNNVLDKDARTRVAIKQWSVEEIQHGRVLGRWAELADPDFDFDRSYKLFRENFSFPIDVSESTRGSRVGELIARCMVETGTTSFYSALADATDEPVLKEICRRIADDEFAHYHMFYAFMRRYLKHENLSFRQRLSVAFQRIAEAEDDELATAYWAANRPNEPFVRRTNSVAYARGTLRYYRPSHIRRMIDMVFGALGLKSTGPLGWFVTRIARAFFWYRGRFQQRTDVLLSRLTSAQP